jgi:arsenate reductase (glutaredoxin)
MGYWKNSKEILGGKKVSFLPKKFQLLWSKLDVNTKGTMTIKIYYHQKCTTCKRALKFLDDRGLDYERVVITEKAPSIAELKKALLSVKEIRKLFNTSGMEYRNRKLKDKVSEMTEDEAFELLNGNGMLVKRPFLIHDKGVFVGFKESEWNTTLCRSE